MSFFYLHCKFLNVANLISQWMSSSFLCFNPYKLEFSIIGFLTLRYTYPLTLHPLPLPLMHLSTFLLLPHNLFLTTFTIYLCCPSLSARSTRHLRSAEQGLLHVPFARTSTMWSRAFSVVDPLVWNSLPLALRSLPRLFFQKFLQQLKTTLFGRTGAGSASE